MIWYDSSALYHKHQHQTPNHHVCLMLNFPKTSIYQLSSLPPLSGMLRLPTSLTTPYHYPSATNTTRVVRFTFITPLKVLGATTLLKVLGLLHLLLRDLCFGQLPSHVHLYYLLQQLSPSPLLFPSPSVALA